MGLDHSQQVGVFLVSSGVYLFGWFGFGVFFFSPLPFFVHEILQAELKHSGLTSNPIAEPDISRQAAIFSSSLRVQQQVTQQRLLGTGTNIARETGWSGRHLSRTLQAQVSSSAQHR